MTLPLRRLVASGAVGALFALAVVAGCRITKTIEVDGASDPIELDLSAMELAPGGVALLDAADLEVRDSVVTGTLGGTPIRAARHQNVLAFIVPQVAPGRQTLELQLDRRTARAEVTIVAARQIPDPSGAATTFASLMMGQARLAAVMAPPLVVTDTAAWRTGVRDMARFAEQSGIRLGSFSVADKAGAARVLADVLGVPRTSTSEISPAVHSTLVDAPEECAAIRANLSELLRIYLLGVAALLALILLTPAAILTLAAGAALVLFLLPATVELASVVATAAMLCGRPTQVSIEQPLIGPSNPQPTLGAATAQDARTSTSQGGAAVRWGGQMLAGHVGGAPVFAARHSMAFSGSAADLQFTRGGAVAIGMSVTFRSLTRANVKPGTPAAEIDQLAASFVIAAEQVRRLGVPVGALPTRLRDQVGFAEASQRVGSERVTIENIRPAAVTVSATPDNANLILRADASGDAEIPFSFDLVYTAVDWPPIRRSVNAVLAARRPPPPQPTVTVAVPPALTGARGAQAVGADVSLTLVCVVPLSGLGEGTARWVSGRAVFTELGPGNSTDAQDIDLGILRPAGDLRGGQVQYAVVAEIAPEGKYTAAPPFRTDLTLSYLRTGASTGITQQLSFVCQ